MMLRYVYELYVNYTSNTTIVCFLISRKQHFIAGPPTGESLSLFVCYSRSAILIKIFDVLVVLCLLVPVDERLVTCYWLAGLY